MKKIDYGSNRVVYNIFQSVIPLMVAQILIILYNVVDRFYIGRIPVTGTVALGGVGGVFSTHHTDYRVYQYVRHGRHTVVFHGGRCRKKRYGQGYTEHLLCSPHYLCGSPYGDRRNMGWTNP